MGWIPKIVRLEMVRQVHMYRLANTLRQKLDLPSLPTDRRLDAASIEAEVARAVEQHLPTELSDVTPIFSNCESRMVREGLDSEYKMIAL